MSTLATFRESLADHDVGWTVAAPGEVAGVVADLIRPPAVGVAPEVDGASLPESVTQDPTPAQLDAAETGVTPAGLGVADHGSLVLAADADGTEAVSLFPAFHVAVLPRSAVVPDLRSALAALSEPLVAGGSAVFATGPSATADMGELVVGAHGPEAVHVVIVEDEPAGDGEGKPDGDDASDDPGEAGR